MTPEESETAFRLSWDAMLKGMQWWQGEHGASQWGSPDEWTAEKGLASEEMYSLVMQLAASDLSRQCRAGQSSQGLRIYASSDYRSGGGDSYVLVNVNHDRQCLIQVVYPDRDESTVVGLDIAMREIRKAVDAIRRA